VTDQRERLLSIDCGTQSVRAFLFDPAGRLVAGSRVPIEMYVSPQPGWAEHDPDQYWDALGRACRALWSEPGVASDDVVGVALTCQRGTVVNVDRDGRPLRPAIVWPDMRRTSGLRPVGGRWGLMFRLAGLGETIAAFQADAESNWIRTHQPDVWAKTAKYLLLSGYLTYRLTGRFVDSVGCQVAYLPFDYRALAWAAPSSWHWQVVPMEPGLLPELVPPTGRLGELTAEAAAATGLPAGRPVIAAGADKACEALGAGCYEPSLGCLSYGTSAAFHVTHQRYVEPMRFVPPYPAALPGGHSLEFELRRGFWLVRWFLEQLGGEERRLAEERGLTPERLLDELAERVPPGSDGLFVQPYWAPGVTVPGPEARGAAVGFTEVHTRAHLYRATLEGLAYALREGKQRIEGRTGVPIRELRAVGGGSRGDATMQLSADIFGLPVARLEVDEAAGLGAAIDAALGLGLHADVEAAVGAMVRPSRIFRPDPARQALYDRLYRRVFTRIYPGLRDLFADLLTILPRVPS
jgi:sugar (pentulose or hexulose) kinase